MGSDLFPLLSPLETGLEYQTICHASRKVYSPQLTPSNHFYEIELWSLGHTFTQKNFSQSKVMSVKLLIAVCGERGGWVVFSRRSYVCFLSHYFPYLLENYRRAQDHRLAHVVLFNWIGPKHSPFICERIAEPKLDKLDRQSSKHTQIRRVALWPKGQWKFISWRR